MNFAVNVNLSRIWKLPVMLAHEQVELGKQEERNLNKTEILFPAFLFS